MAELTEIPLELQLKEANRRIKIHLSKGRKFQQFLSPMFLRRFPAIMENHISIDWNTILGVYDRTPTLPITLIDMEILDDWFNHPQVWDVSCDLQHAQHVLALIRHMLPTPYKGQPAIVFGASFVFVPAYQARTNLCDGLTFLKGAKEDSVVLVAMPSKPTYSPQPRRGRYLTLSVAAPTWIEVPCTPSPLPASQWLARRGVAVTCPCASRCRPASGPPNVPREN